jgi:NADH-quinone oxidoreductase subunit I
MGLKDVIKKGVFVDILRGMSVTGTYFVVDKVTVEYPKEKLQTYPRFRGVQALLADPATGDPKCVACMLCATICPSRCISITGEQAPDGRSRPAAFDLDLSRCLFCGLCEEVCPEAAIVMTRHYELATFDKNDFYLDKERLLANQGYVHKELYALPADGGGPAAAGATAAGATTTPEAGASGAVTPEAAKRGRP